MTIMIENYRHADLKDVVSVWNESLIYDPVTEKRFLQLVELDENFDESLALVAKENEKIIGFSLGLRRKYPYLSRGFETERAWISVFFIHPQYRKKGYGAELLAETESRLISCGAKNITLCAYSPNYFAPGINVLYTDGIRFFENHGYPRGEKQYSMARELYTYTIPEKTIAHSHELEKNGITFKMYEDSCKDSLLELTNREFGAGWTLNVLHALQKNEAEETIILAIKDEKVIGYCMRKIDGNDGRFGPIGVSEKYRDEGIGGVLLDLQMREMQKRCIYSFYCLWTGGAAARFYEKHGLTPMKTYYLYRKEV